MWTLPIVILLVVVYRIIKWHLGKNFVSDISGKYVFVTGCDTGFGNLLAIRLDEMGVHVIAGCLTERGRKKLEKKTTSRLVTVLHDVSNENSTKRAVELVSDLLPADKGLWGLVNNAGILGDIGPCEWMRTEQYLKTFKVNLFGVIETTRQFLPLIRREKGRVVNTSSSAGSVPFTNIVPYCISKHGVEVYSDCLRKDVHRFGMSVHMVKPLGYRTEIAQLDVIKSKMSDLYNKVEENVREDYGSFTADKLYNKFFNNNSMKVSDKTYQVVDAYIHALMSRHPSYRYRVGDWADTLWRVPEFLPDYLSDVLYHNTIGK